jgi:protease-4
LDKRTVAVLLAIFGSLFLALFGFLFIAWIAIDGASAPSFGKGRIGVVEVKGAIMDSDEIVEQLHDFGEDERIRAVILRIDSPGGAVAPSQEIAGEVRKLGEKKPVVASMGNMAASGGYYVAAPASRIVANAGTITGSIGVITQVANLSEITDRLGFRMNTVKSGAAKDAGNPFRPFTDEDRALFQTVVDTVYEQFVREVAEGRDLPEEQVKAVADGRILTGETALEAGLVDELGNFRDAVDLAAELAGIEGDPQLVYPRGRRSSGLEHFFAEGARAVVAAGADELRATLEGKADAPAVQFLLPGY